MVRDGASFKQQFKAQLQKFNSILNLLIKCSRTDRFHKCCNVQVFFSLRLRLVVGAVTFKLQNNFLFIRLCDETRAASELEIHFGEIVEFMTERLPRRMKLHSAAFRAGSEHFWAYVCCGINVQR